MAGRGGRRRPSARAAGGAGRRAAGRPVSDERLIELVWGEDAPANATKSLQVLVSRTRAACGPDAIVRDGAGLSARRRSESSSTAVRLVGVSAMPRRRWSATRGGPRRSSRARRWRSPTACPLSPWSATMAARWGRSGGRPRRTRPRREPCSREAWSRTGRHDDALAALEAAHAEHPEDEPLLADLLRSEAAVRGPAPRSSATSAPGATPRAARRRSRRALQRSTGSCWR